MTVISLISARTAGKSTNSAWLAQVLADIGKKKVYGFDTDKSQQWLAWRETTEYPYTVFGVPKTSVHQSVDDLNAEDVWCLLDGGHLEDHRDIGLSSCKKADVAIINCAATMSDFERLYVMPMKNTEEKPDQGFLEATALVRPDGQQVPAVVLLTRVDGRSTKMLRQIRSFLVDEGYDVLETVIPATNMYAQTGEGMPLVTSWIEKKRDKAGKVVERIVECAHAAVLDELHDKGLVPAWR